MLKNINIKRGDPDGSPRRVYGRVGLCLLDGFVAASVGEVGNRSSHEDGCQCADDDAEQHCEDERADGVATKDEDYQEHEQCRT